MSKIVWGSKFSCLTRSRPLDFTFSEDFCIWKVPFALQIDIYDNSVAKNTWIWYFSKNNIFHLSLKYEFWTVPLFQLQQGSIYEEILLFSTKNWSFLRLQCIFKQVKTEKKIFRQSWTKHLETFSLFSTISLHHKWNGTILLSPESECMSCLMSCRTT